MRRRECFRANTCCRRPGSTKTSPIAASMFRCCGCGVNWRQTRSSHVSSRPNAALAMPLQFPSTMNANRLIEEWRRQGRVLDVEGANTVLWRKGQGESGICVHGVPTSGFLYRKLLPELASRGLAGVTFDLPGLGLADRPADLDYSWR